MAPVFYESRASLNPEGTLLASSSFGGPVCLWDTATGREIARLVGHDTGSVDVAFHPDGDHLAVAGGNNHEITLWDLRRLGAGPLSEMRGLDEARYCRDHRGRDPHMEFSRASPAGEDGAADGLRGAAPHGQVARGLLDLRVGRPLARRVRFGNP